MNEQLNLQPENNLDKNSRKKQLNQELGEISRELSQCVMGQDDNRVREIGEKIRVLADEIKRIASEQKK